MITSRWEQDGKGGDNGVGYFTISGIGTLIVGLHTHDEFANLDFALRETWRFAYKTGRDDLKAEIARME